jgi:hypothetical protein
MRSVLAISLMVCSSAAGQAPDVANPFKKAKAGEWVEYKMTGPNIEGKTKMTIVAKDDKEVSYEVASSFSFMGKEMTAPIQKLNIDLTKSYDPISAANLKANNVKIEQMGEGKEKLKVAGKEIDTKWNRLKATATVNCLGSA